LSEACVGATWQRYKVHLLRNVASAAPKLHAPAVLSVVKSIFLHPTREAACDAVNDALNVFEPRFPRGSQAPCSQGRCARQLGLPVHGWRSDLIDQPIECVNAELDRRAKVVGIFSNTDSLPRLFTAVLHDQHDE
jgi:putative transposase